MKGDAVKLTGPYTVDNVTAAEDMVFGQAMAAASTKQRGDSGEGARRQHFRVHGHDRAFGERPRGNCGVGHGGQGEAGGVGERQGAVNVKVDTGGEAGPRADLGRGRTSRGRKTR